MPDTRSAEACIAVLEAPRPVRPLHGGVVEKKRLLLYFTVVNPSDATYAWWDPVRGWKTRWFRDESEEEDWCTHSWNSISDRGTPLDSLIKNDTQDWEGQGRSDTVLA